MHVPAQRGGNPAPAPAMIASAMNQHKRRRSGAPLIDVVQPQPLRKIDPRSRARTVEVEGHDLPARHSGHKRPPRARSVKRGSVVRSLTSRPDRSPGYILDFALGCRCQGVGNWELPGGVMLATHPPAKLTTG